jgi:enoyl-CoA hydratase/carnithine racemase
MTEAVVTAETPIVFSTDAGIAQVTLNRPAKMNALTPEMLVRLDRAWRAIEDDPTVRVAVLAGAGARAFCAGADLGRLTPLLTRTREAEDEWDEALLADPPLLNRALLRGADVTTPVIAEMRGAVVGGGMELMLACDLRVAGESAQFGLPEVTRGLIAAAGGVARISRQITRARAAEIVLTGERISAADALSWGLINRVVPDDEVHQAALTLARRIAENAPLALRAAKQVMTRGSGRPIADAFAAEDEVITSLLRSKDAREGSRAFVQKRRPNFTGE